MSPRGADSFNKHNAAVEQRREEQQAQFGPKADYFKIDGGQFAAIRFLEQGTDIAWASMHRVPVAGSPYPRDVVCLDQQDDGTPCPFCQSGFKGVRARSTKGFYNVLWRGNAGFQSVNQQILANNAQLLQQGQPPQSVYTLAPIYKRNEYGTPEKDSSKNPIILGYEDGIFLWKCSKTVHDQIISKDSAYHGLCSRDFVVTRQGKTKDDTKYFIEPLDVNAGAVPMSDQDIALVNAEGKRYDLDKFIEPMSYEAAAQMVPPGSDDQPGLGAMQASPVGATFNRGGGGFAGMPPVPVAPMPQGQPQPAQQAQPQLDPNGPTPFSHPAPGSTAAQS
jgi:hypothetical protein